MPSRRPAPRKSNKIQEIQEFHENPRKSKKINKGSKKIQENPRNPRNPRKSKKIQENPRKFKKIQKNPRKSNTRCIFLTKKFRVVLPFNVVSFVRFFGASEGPLLQGDNLRYSACAAPHYNCFLIWVDPCYAAGGWDINLHHPHAMRGCVNNIKE